MKYFILILVSAVLFSCQSQNIQTAQSEDSTIYLVRHAEKEDDGTRDPELTNIGKARANNLSILLREAHIDFIYSSDYQRTTQTAQPIADQLDKDIMIYDPRDFTTLIETINQNSGKNFLVVGHSNSTPTLANEILGEELYEQFDESDYGNIIKIAISNKQKNSKLIRF